jgi:hypothetical protein
VNRRLSTALAVFAALALLAGCGGDKKTIPTDEGASLIRLLRVARDQAGDPNKCPQLLATVQRINLRVAGLPASVDQDTRASLVNGVNNLIDNARSECAGAQTTPTTETTPPETTPSVTTPPPTTQTTPTTPPETTPTTPPETTPTTPGNGGTGVPPGQQKKGGKEHKKEGDE